MKNNPEISLDDFRGPLDLLLHLIDKNKVDIYDIPIVEITDQYIDFIEKSEDKLNIASEFIVTAATLISIKTRMLLPKYEEEEDPRTELVDRLIEYRYYKKVSEELERLEKNGNRTMIKGPTIPDEVAEFEFKPDVTELFSGTNIKELGNVFRELLKRYDERIDEVRSNFSKVEEDRWTVSDRIDYLREKIQTKKRFNFSEVIEEAVSRLQVIVTFLAMLELTKIGEVQIYQDDTLSDIKVEVFCG